jgi:aminopeptidase N
MQKIRYSSIQSMNVLILMILLILINSSCKTGGVPEISPGVSQQLAQYRKKAIDSLYYHLSFQIPASKEEHVYGRNVTTVFLKIIPEKLVFDFNAPVEYLTEVKIDNSNVDFLFIEEHIIIPGEYLKKGKNQVEFGFMATNQALNRQNDFMYTLFVPERASTAFPCFDQPDLKAGFQLELVTPEKWKSVANGIQTGENIVNGEKHSTFATTKPIPTYLFSFAAGVFDTLKAEKNGMNITMYHRETDSEKVKRNSPDIFEQHFSSIEWLEEYTGVAYPFDKFDFVVIPNFQYGGMEHPGAILYRGSRFFLDKNATQTDLLSRANLIAHETAHMWFGDLVTMRWFNDVWMKEVFANFLADKMVNPIFPDINHKQRFLYAHFPSAYEIDRSKGANPIRQHLDNMKNAGTLYGNIIYHKAPIMMNQLEKILGEDKLREGLREYLAAYAFDNADWPDLIKILDDLSDRDLKEWSRIWVDETGMPVINIEINDSQTAITITQSDPENNQRLWSQILEPAVFSESGIISKSIPLDKTEVQVNIPDEEYYLVLPDISGEAYGYFKTNEASRDWLMENLPQLKNPLHRAAGILLLWEEMLNGVIPPGVLFNSYLEILKKEEDQLNAERILNHLKTIFWKFFNTDAREKIAENFEEILLSGLNEIEDKGSKNAYFRTYYSIVTSEKGISFLREIWDEKAKIAGLELSESDFINLSYELALKNPDSAEQILSVQLNRISNPDRRESYRFIMPALAKEESTRDAFFESMKNAENRKVEPRILLALEFLHHPLRTDHAIAYIQPSLEMLEEIQLTGDIFFPTNWLGATLKGHQSEQAKEIVDKFLENNPGYPANLKGKILQSADLLFRVVEINKKSGQ